MRLTIQRDDRNTTILSDQALRCLSWAPYRPSGPFCEPIHALVNTTLSRDEFVDADHLRHFSRRRLRELAVNPRTAILLLTAVPQTHLRHEMRCVEHTGLRVEVFCTAGMGNAIAPGDPTMYDEELVRICQPPGTINIIVVINRSLTDDAMLELVQVVTMAKCQALYTFGQKSSKSDRIALGTGTDCIVLAGLARSDRILSYGGLSTTLGSTVARAVERAVATTVEAQRKHLTAPY